MNNVASTRLMPGKLATTTCLGVTKLPARILMHRLSKRLMMHPLVRDEQYVVHANYCRKGYSGSSNYSSFACRRGVLAPLESKPQSQPRYSSDTLPEVSQKSTLFTMQGRSLVPRNRSELSIYLRHPGDQISHTALPCVLRTRIFSNHPKCGSNCYLDSSMASGAPSFGSVVQRRLTSTVIHSFLDVCDPFLEPSWIPHRFLAPALQWYSGVSWCWSGLPDDIKLVTRWQTRFNFTSDSAKTPTELCYDTTDGKPAWGFDIPANKEAIAWFKLLLVDQDKLPEKYRESKQLMRARKLAADASKTPVDLVADYLRLLWKHTLDSIKRERGDVAVDGSPFRVWLTVPAIWDAISCSRMREAAEKAGILSFRSAGPTVLDLVAEPEAAALAVLDDFRKAPNVQDIISYTVLNVDPVGLQECVEGQGALCGAVRIDEAFLSMVKANLGEPRWEKTSTEDRKIMMYNEWENGIKRRYDDSDRDWTVSLPAIAFKGRSVLHGFSRRMDVSSAEVPMQSGQLKLARGHIRAFFAPVLSEIRGLIHDQIRKVEVMAGKLPKELKTEFLPKHIDVLQPSGDRPWVAICRGAVMRGLSDTTTKTKHKSTVKARVSRKSYGTAYRTVFDKHNELDKTWCPIRLQYLADRQMQWYLRRGEIITHTEPVSFKFFLWISKESQLEDMMRVDVFENDELIPPGRQTDKVRRLLTLSFRGNTSFDDLPTWTNPMGIVFRKLDFAVGMYSTGTSLKWRVTVDGVVQGEQDVRIQHDWTSSTRNTGVHNDSVSLGLEVMRI
nr:hypothetical protein CFP56_09551 [Quercus suber]